MEVTTVAIDLAKNVFALCGADAKGRVVLRRELRRAQLPDFMRRLGPCVVGMEASGGAHHWARQFAAFGHEVRLISPWLVRPYRKGNKTDRNDAEAILEAVTRPTMRFVAVKSVAQQDLLALHRVRSQLVKTRTALCNQLHGYCASAEWWCASVRPRSSAPCRRHWLMRVTSCQARCASY